MKYEISYKIILHYFGAERLNYLYSFHDNLLSNDARTFDITGKASSFLPWVIFFQMSNLCYLCILSFPHLCISGSREQTDKHICELCVKIIRMVVIIKIKKFPVLHFSDVICQDLNISLILQYSQQGFSSWGSISNYAIR